MFIVVLQEWEADAQARGDETMRHFTSRPVNVRFVTVKYLGAPNACCVASQNVMLPTPCRQAARAAPQMP